MPGIVWWEIETTDPERFQQYFAALWGWTFESAFADTDLDADYWVIRQDGQGIGGVQRAEGAASAPSAGTRIYFPVDDLEGTLERILALGGEVQRRRTALGGDDRWFGIFRDPVGNSFGLWTEHAAHQA